jgi:hypothetical protein
MNYEFTASGDLRITVKPEEQEDLRQRSLHPGFDTREMMRVLLAPLILHTRLKWFIRHQPQDEIHYAPELAIYKAGQKPDRWQWLPFDKMSIQSALMESGFAILSRVR